MRVSTAEDNSCVVTSHGLPTSDYSRGVSLDPHESIQLASNLIFYPQTNSDPTSTLSWPLRAESPSQKAWTGCSFWLLGKEGWCKEGVWPLIPVAAISKKQELFYTLFWDGHSDLATRQRRGSGENKVSFIHRSWRQEAHRATWINPSVVKRQKAGLKRKLRLRHLLRLPQQRQSREGWAVQFQPVSLMREIDS